MPPFEFLTPRRPRPVPLVELARVAGATVVGDAGDVTVTNVAVSGAELRPGGLFAALPGRRAHGAEHWSQARDSGAVAVLTDRAGLRLLPRDDVRGDGVPVLVVDDPRAVLGRVAARVSGTDRHVPQLFGVTGTNGKTTTVHLLDAVLDQLGVPAGLSSTADRRSGSATVVSRLTSPEAPELHALLARMVEDGVRAAALEVSAQALTHHRVDGLVLDVAGFTGLSHDHLDEYASMDDYLEAKLALFTPEHARVGVVLLDSPAGRVVRDRATIPVTTVSSVHGVPADWTVTVLAATHEGTRFALCGPAGQEVVTTVPLVGRHMAADAGLALVMLLEAGHDLDRLQEALEDGVRVSIPGRTELQSGPDGPRLYTDFSHTPDSVEKTLAALRAVTPGRLVVIVGADGEKDATKRGPMGRAAAEGADLVIVTDHHQRFEDPARIRRALLDGAHAVRRDDVLEVPDPSEAVRTAVARTTTGDTILWVGPGHIDYRIVRGVDTPYSPRDDARRALVEAGWSPPPPRTPSVRAPERARSTR